MYTLIVSFLVLVGIVGGISGVCIIAGYFEYDEQKHQNPARAANELRVGRIGAMIFIGCVIAFASMWPLLEYTGSEKHAPIKMSSSFKEAQDLRNKFTLKQFQKNTILVQQYINKSKKVQQKTLPKYKTCVWLVNNASMDIFARTNCTEVLWGYNASVNARRIWGPQ